MLKINNFSISNNIKFAGKSIPYSNQAKHFHIDTEKEDNDRIILSTFRDDELFDEETDTINSGYTGYDEDDIIPERQHKDYADIDYRIVRYNDKITSKEGSYNIINPDKEMSKDRLMLSKFYPVNGYKAVPAILNASIMKDKDGKGTYSPKMMVYFNDLYRRTRKVENIDIYRKAVISIGHDGGEQFDSISSDFITKLRRNGIPAKDCSDITTACKLRNSDGSQSSNSVLREFTEEKLLTKYKPEYAAPIINNLKKEQYGGNEIIDIERKTLAENLIRKSAHAKTIIEATSK